MSGSAAGRQLFLEGDAMTMLLNRFVGTIPWRRVPHSSAFCGVLLVVAIAGCESHSVMERQAALPQQDQPVDRQQTSIDAEPQESKTADSEDLTFPGFRLVQDKLSQRMSEDAPADEASQEKERSIEKQAVHDLDVIKANLKLAVEYNDERYSLVGRIANSGEQDILFNTELVGYYGSVKLKWRGEFIPRDPKSPFRTARCAGPSSAYNLVLPGRSMYQCLSGNSSWVRQQAIPRAEQLRRIEEMMKNRDKPFVAPRTSFHDDLLDFDWSAVSGRIELVVCQQLVHKMPEGDWVTYQIESNPITVDVDALKAYRNRLLKKGEELRKAEEDTNKPDLAQGRD
jgi:hypothetical protein